MNTEKAKNLKIAISGASGCGNTTVSNLLAETLGLPCINYTFKNVAKEMNISFSELLERAKTDYSFDKLVDSKQVEMAGKAPCVLGSRLAIWLLEEADFRVYLDASISTRAKRILEREGGELEDIKQRTIARDKDDTRRYKELYDIDNTKYDFVDLVVDTEKLLPQEIVELIIKKISEKY